MVLTLDLPPDLARELERAAAAEGVSQAELGTLLLYLGAAVATRHAERSIAETAAEYLAEVAAEAPAPGAPGVLREPRAPYGERAVRLALRTALAGILATPQGQALLQHFVTLAQGGTTMRESTVSPSTPAARASTGAMGKYAHVRLGSEEYAQEKQREIEREERRSR